MLRLPLIICIIILFSAVNAFAGSISAEGGYEEALVYSQKFEGTKGSSPEVAQSNEVKRPKGIVNQAKAAWTKLKSWVFSKEEAQPVAQPPQKKEVKQVAQPVVKEREKTEAELYLEAQPRNAKKEVQTISEASKEFAQKGGIVVVDGGKSATPNKGLVLKKNKAPTYEPIVKLKKVESIPRLDIGQEPKVSASDYSINNIQDALGFGNLNYKLKLKPALTKKDKKKLAESKKFKVRKTAMKTKAKTSKIPVPKMGVEDVLALDLAKLKESLVQERAYNPLSKNEMLMLGGLLLFRQKGECASAASLFHHLSRFKDFKNEAYFHLSICGKRLKLLGDHYEYAIKVLNTRDPFYAKEMALYVKEDVPSEFLEAYGSALYGALRDKNLNLMSNDVIKNSASLVVANWALQTKKFSLALKYAGQVDKNYDKYYQALYYKAIANYALNRVKEGIDVQKTLYQALNTSKSDKKFEALAALNLARMEFQSGLYVRSQKNFLKVYKDHPLWLPSLFELGWAQLQSGDYSGAIGNMYSLHSPFFKHIYKPETYVIRSIGYLKLCQYGDAYRSLTRLEKTYRPFMDEIGGYTKKNKKARTYYSTVKKYLRSNRKVKIDGLSPEVIREMARHRDFINLQKSLNRGIDETKVYNGLANSIHANIKKYKKYIARSKERVKMYKVSLKPPKKGSKRKPLSKIEKDTIKSRIGHEANKIETYKFILAIHKDTLKYQNKFKKRSLKALKKRNFKTKAEVELVLAARLFKMKKDLKMYLDNNEFLRYEVFSGSGENIRFQAAGGQVEGKRIPANVIPESKELKWDFDGEYWADEVGHYKSSLKSNCPEAKNRGQASVGGF